MMQATTANETTKIEYSDEKTLYDDMAYIKTAFETFGIDADLSDVSDGTVCISSALAAQEEPLMRETDAEGEYVGTTFIQAIDHIMRKYKLVSERSGKGKTPVIFFCTDLPQQRESADSPWSRRENWERKRLAILECCVRNGVACLDLYSLCGFDMT